MLPGVMWSFGHNAAVSDAGGETASYTDIRYCGDGEAGGAVVAGAGAGFFLRFVGVVLAGPSFTTVVVGGGAGWAAAAC